MARHIGRQGQRFEIENFTALCRARFCKRCRVALHYHRILCERDRFWRFEHSNLQIRLCELYVSMSIGVLMEQRS